MRESTSLVGNDVTMRAKTDHLSLDSGSAVVDPGPKKKRQSVSNTQKRSTGTKPREKRQNKSLCVKQKDNDSFSFSLHQPEITKSQMLSASSALGFRWGIRMRIFFARVIDLEPRLVRSTEESLRGA